MRSKFYWQDGFGGFTYSKSQIDTVAKYILNQAEHHKKVSFKDKYMGILKKYGINYDDKYLFTWYE